MTEPFYGGACCPPSSVASPRRRPQKPASRAWTFLMEVMLSPIFWLVVLQLCLLWALTLVGYLSVPEDDEVLDTVLVLSPRGAEYRAGLAYSGVTLGITFGLALTSLAWAVSAFLRKGPSFPDSPAGKRRVLILVAVILVAFLFAQLVTGWAKPVDPFPSELGVSVLKWVYGQPAQQDVWVADKVPDIMFFLSIVVPAILAAGASFLQEPIDESIPEERTRKVALRVRELDQLLYIGALALVFGTLQLSASLSVPLASMPKAADLKNEMELCRMFGGAAAGSPLLEQFNAKDCLDLPRRMEQEESVAGLRQLVRAVTFSLGLAFSAMLVAIYVPAMVSLRLMLPSDGTEPAAQASGSDKSASPGDVDPLHRIAAVAATLGPLIAGIVANAFGGG